MRRNANTGTATVIQVMEYDSKALRGMRFCLSGHMGVPRTEVAGIIRKAGGKVVELLGFGTILVTNQDWQPRKDGRTISAKLEAANRIGAKIISEADLYDMIVSKDTQ